MYLYIDDENGVTWIEDGRANQAHSVDVLCLHDSSSNGHQMIQQGYWRKDAIYVRGNDGDINISESHYDWIISVDSAVKEDSAIMEFYKILAESCQCKECKRKRSSKE